MHESMAISSSGTMNVEVKTAPQSRRVLRITVPAATWMQEIDAAATHIGAQMKIKGFRAGKVPAAVVMREVGRDAVVAEAAERAIKKAYAAAVTRENIAAIAAPTVEVEQLKDGEDLIFTATVDVMPTVTLAKGWRTAVAKVRRACEKEHDVAVTEQDVNAAIDSIAQRHAQQQVVDRAAKEGDVAIIDFTATMDGAPLEGGSSTNHPLVLGSGAFIPGFEDALIGMRAGEKKDVTLTFPEKYHAKHLAGKTATFAVTVNRVEERVLPEQDDAFAAKVAPGAKTMDDARAQVRDNLTQEKVHARQQACREKMLDILASQVVGDIPASMIDREIAQMEEQFRRQLASSGTTLEATLENLGKTIDDLRADWRPQGEKRARIALALDAIAAEEKIAPSKDAVEAKMQELLLLYGGGKNAKDIDTAQLYRYAQGILTQEAVFAVLDTCGATRTEEGRSAKASTKRARKTKEDA